MSLDLLEQRRQQLGVAPDRPLAWRPLLLPGGLIAAAILGVLIAAGVLLSLRQALLRGAVAALAPQAEASERLRRQGQAQLGQARQLEAANRTLAEAVVAVPSSSAWLLDLARRVPQGVQLSQAVVNGRQLSLAGVAADPDGFIRINALQLGLQRSPLLLPGSVQLRKAERQSAGNDNPARTIRFDLEARFRDTVPLLDAEQLQQLGAAGMAHRLEVVQNLGVLP
ncbi:MAG: PilN domain-containing protein [Synechococcus sp.]|nr:PilN domain-containing protein [Synechococcus sp.]